MKNPPFFCFHGERPADREQRQHDRQQFHRIIRSEVSVQQRDEEDDQQRCREKMLLQGIREQYLGVSTSKMKKRGAIKRRERFGCKFSWDDSEDTSSQDMNPFYQIPHEVQLLFGRGFRAGMDRWEQKKLIAVAKKKNYYAKDQLLPTAQVNNITGPRLEEGVEELELAEAAHEKQIIKSEAAADMAADYDTFDMRVNDRRSRHWSEKMLEEMTQRDWRILAEDLNISYKGSRGPPPAHPMRNWDEGNLSTRLLKAVYRAGYEKPSPIQMSAIPLGLQHRDVIGIAETGSGKTAAYVLPMLAYVSQLPRMTEENEADGPYALVLAPTRELAQQIEQETLKLATYLDDIHVVSVVGGKPIQEQSFKLRERCEIVIATPGRLLDCFRMKYVVLNQCNYVVLDEADRMVDLGFEQQVMGVLDAMPSRAEINKADQEELDEKKTYRTTCMFSATMPPAVEWLASKYLRNPVVLNVGTAGKAVDSVTQHVSMLNNQKEKLQRLRQVLEHLGEKTSIIFVNTRKSADTLSKHLDQLGICRVTSLHGGKTQEQREISLEGFRNKRFNCLVATNIAARGIDVPDVSHVINYNMPYNIQTYTHRIGRTGRAGKTGVASSFITLDDTHIFFDLKRMLIQNNSPVPHELARHEASKFKPNIIPGCAPQRNGTLYHSLQC